MIDREPELLAMPWLQPLSTSRRADLLESAVFHAVPAGTLLFEQGDMPSFQHVVLSGSVQLFGRSSIGREVLIEIVEPPDLVIPAAVVTASSYLMRARVPEPARLLLIHAAAFRRAVEREPLLAHAVIGSLAGQFRRLVRQIKNLKLRTASERVGCYLLALSQRQGTPDLAVLPYEKNLIASELGMTRESFSRALSALQAEGITVKGDGIEIWDAQRLAAACGPDPLIDGREDQPPEQGSRFAPPHRKPRARPP
jgi:CRP/FNR family transcriptional regulator, transcriptional activator FtrB